VINVHKPAGLTSRDIVNRVQRLTAPAKAGHAGTLDPLATGVLLVCVGKATRLIDYAQRMQKQYRGTFLLGRTSDTEDVDGLVTMLSDPPQPSVAEIAAMAATFLGETLQRPPAYSALRIAGRRAYELARAGKTVVLEPRPITIHSIDIIAYEYPELTLDIICGSGTYVRSLGRDLAERLGTGAVMSALVRTRIGGFTLADAWDPKLLRPENASEWLTSPGRLVAETPCVTLTAHQANEIAEGRYIELVGMEADDAMGIAAFSPDGELHSILRSRGPGQYGARINLGAVPGSG